MSFQKTCAFLTLCVLIVAATELHAAPPQPISYQGRLTYATGGPFPDGNYGIAFAIYADSSGGLALWTEEQAVATTDGLFTALLGSIKPFPADLFEDYPRYLEISIMGGAELSPRQLISLAPYAIKAKNSDMLDGLHSTAFLQGVPNPLMLSGNNPGSFIIMGTNNSDANSSAGVRGETSAPSGHTFGLRGVQRTGASAMPTEGAGVFGESDTRHGVVGFTLAQEKWFGVWGYALANSGPACGVSGETASPDGIAVHGLNRNTSAMGELGSKFTTTLGGTFTYNAGVVATSPEIGGHCATSSAGYAGFFAESETWNGLAGVTNSGYGVWGQALTEAGAGVRALGSGISSSSQGTAIEIIGGGLAVPDAGLNTPTPVFIHQATSLNIAGAVTYIDHPLTNGKPGAILIVTQNWSAGGTFNPHMIAAYYSPVVDQWGIFNEDLANMPVGAAFNVLVFNNEGVKAAEGNALTRDGRGGAVRERNVPISSAVPNVVTEQRSE